MQQSEPNDFRSASSPAVFRFGGLDREVLEISVLDYEREPFPGQYQDNNWLKVDLSISVGNFTGFEKVALLTDELNSLLSALRKLQETLVGKVDFSTVEGQLSLVFTADGRGHISINGEIVDYSHRNKIAFTLEIDQTQLGQSIHQLERAVAMFPTLIL